MRPQLSKSSLAWAASSGRTLSKAANSKRGPDSYIAAKPAVTELAEQIPGLSGEIIAANEQSRRIFLVKDGALLPMPTGMAMMVPGDMRAALTSPLFSESTKRRFLRERHQKPRQRTADVSIAEFVRIISTIPCWKRWSNHC